MKKNSKESIWIVLLNLINICKINLNNYESMFIETDGIDKLINQLKQQKIETKIQNSEGAYVDLYIPRKCHATNRLLDCKDTASVQITLNTDGLNYENKKQEQNNLTMVISGFVRTKGNSDAALNKILYENKILSFC